MPHTALRRLAGEAQSSALNDRTTVVLSTDAMRLTTAKVLALLSTVSVMVALWLTKLPWYRLSGKLYFINGRAVDPALPGDYDPGAEFIFVFPTIVVLVLNLIAYTLVFLKRCQPVAVVGLLCSLLVHCYALFVLVIAHPYSHNPAFQYVGYQYVVGLALITSLVTNVVLLYRLWRHTRRPMSL